MAFTQKITSMRTAYPLASVSRKHVIQSMLPNLSQRRTKHYLAASAKTFEERLNTHDDRLVIADFYADWCGPCRMLSPILERATADTQYSNGKEVDLVTINTDDEGELAQKYKVSALPTVIAFRNGQAVDQFVGASPAPTVQKWLERLTS